MEYNDLKPEDSYLDTRMELTDEALAYLSETRKWTLFFSILGFIGVGFMILIAFSFGSIFSMMNSFSPAPTEFPFPTSIFTGMYLVIALIYFFPFYYLYQFAVHTKRGIQERNQDDLTLGFKYLKSHYKYIGIVAIIFISIYVLAIGGALIFGAMLG